MANNFYGAILLTGGATGALDAIDGAGLVDLDSAIVQTDGNVYFYSLDAISGAAESSPDIISPDTNAGTKRWVLQNVGGGYIRLHDLKATTVNGGTFTAGAWQKRDIAEDQDTNNNVSIASNVITLEAGTYDCLIKAPAFRVNRSQAKLVNTSDTVDTILGSCEYNNDTALAGEATVASIIQGRFTITSQKNFEIQHRCETTKTNSGFGVATSFGGDEIYTVAEFWKV